MSKKCENLCPYMEAETRRIDKVIADQDKYEERHSKTLNRIFDKLDRLPNWAVVIISILSSASVGLLVFALKSI